MRTGAGNRLEVLSLEAETFTAPVLPGSLAGSAPCPSEPTDPYPRRSECHRSILFLQSYSQMTSDFALVRVSPRCQYYPSHAS